MPVRGAVRNQSASPLKKNLAKRWRREMTPAEACLWAALRNNQLAGLHFRRQQVLFGFIVDFYCHAASLVVEVDGSVHRGQEAQDGQRDRALEERGVRVLHFTNTTVAQDLARVLACIRQACAMRLGC